MKLRVIVAAALLACAALVTTSVAGADPIHAKRATRVEAICSGKTVMVVVNGNGRFTPAHDLASTSVFIPTAFDVTFTFTPTGGSPQVMHNTATKRARIRNTTTCTIPLQTIFSGPQGTTTIQGTVTGFWTPR
jgi:hypothetical protein